MSDYKIKRKGIFKKYATNLQLLIKNGFIACDEIQGESYVCPLCLTIFIDPEEENPLTLEDAPPKSLGGTANILTCKSCNNTCGHEIDFHLTERLKEIDSKQFKPGTETKVRIKIENETFQGILKVEENGELHIIHSKKNNHPVKLDQEMQKLAGGEIVDLNFIKSRVIPERLEYALLKTGYLLAFQKFGYSLMLDHCYDIVRDQLLNPEERIYPSGFWLKAPYPKEMCGVYFVLDKGLECLISIFELKTDRTSGIYVTILPLPVQDINTVIPKIHEKEGEFTLQLYPPPNDLTEDYLLDTEVIKSMHDWFRRRTIDK